MVMMALFPQLVGHTSYNWALGFLPAASVSIVVIAEPVGATLTGRRNVTGLSYLSGNPQRPDAYRKCFAACRDCLCQPPRPKNRREW